MQEYDAYLEMGNAVIEQACNDYIYSQLKLMNIKKKVNPETGEVTYSERYRGDRKMKDKNITNCRRMIIDCIVFFKSDWCIRLSPNCNGQKLINILNERVKQDVADFEKQKEELLKKREEEKLKKKEERRRKKMESK